MGKCKWCGKPLPKQEGRGRPKKYCSNLCKTRAYHERQHQKCLNIPEDHYINNPKYKQEDYKLKFKDKNFLFTENDNNWGLGESNLSEHAENDKNLEAYYIKQELKRIFSRKILKYRFNI